MGELDMVYHLFDYCLSNQVVFDRGRIQPGGKIYFKNAHQYQNHNKGSNIGKLDMVYNKIDHGLFN